MEPQAFDALSRRFAQGAQRRTVLKTLTAAWAYGVFRPILQIGKAVAATTCDAAAIAACKTTADSTFERETSDCADVRQPGACRAAARRRHDAAVKACNPCPANTRCESNVCCPNSQATCAPPCAISRSSDGTKLAANATGTVRGQALALVITQSMTSPVTVNGQATAAKPVTASKRSAMTLGGAELLTVTSSMSAGVNRVDVSYGAAFQGIKSASFTVQGGQIQGTIDGRSVIPFASGTDANLMTFQDGRAPPAVAVDADILAAMNDAQRKIGAVISTCPNPTRVVTESKACIACEDLCSSADMVCVGGVSVGCLFTFFGFGACEAIGLGVCQEGYDTCHKIGCEQEGAPCCPQQCNGGCCEQNTTCCANALHGLRCCPAGTRCASEGTENGICCPQNSGPLCVDHCCAAGESCLEGRICCPAGSRLCGDVCCPGDQLCLRGVCCLPGSKDCGDGQCCQSNSTCLNGACCAAPGHICGGRECCAPFDVCCSNTCCGGDNLCISGQVCCPRTQVCGTVCCPPGGHCVNGSCAGCPGDTVACNSVGSNGVVVSICCGPRANCCLGVCCTNETGHECTGTNPPGSCGTIH